MYSLSHDNYTLLEINNINMKIYNSKKQQNIYVSLSRIKEKIKIVTK